MAGRFDFDSEEPVLADALADAGAAAAGTTTLDEYSAIRHAGAPKPVTIDLSGVDVEAIIEACNDHAASWQDRVEAVRWEEHRAVVELPDVSVETIELATGLRTATAVGSVMVYDAEIPGAMPWQWPLKIGWVPGSIGEEVADAFTNGHGGHWMHSLVQFVAYGHDTMPGLIDLLIVPEHEDPHPLLSSRGVQANALILADEKTPASDRLDQAREIADHLNAGAILLPRLGEVGELVDWLDRLIEEVSHKNPLDVAMGKSTPIGIVIGNKESMTAPLQNVTFRMADRAHDYLGTAVGRPRRPPAFAIGGPEHDETMAMAPPPLPGDLELLQEPDDMAHFSMESGGATRVREFREANDLNIDLLPDASPQRMLKAAIFQDRDGDGLEEEIEHAFIAGGEHWIHLWIGSGATGFLSAETPAGDAAFLDADDVLPDVPADIVVWGDGLEMQIEHVMVSSQRVSELASFSFTVPQRAKEYKLNIALLVEGRVVQSGVVGGPVTPSGGKPRRANAPVLRFVVGPNLVDLTALDNHFPTDTITIMEHEAGAHTMFRADLHSMKVDSLAAHFQRSIALLVEAQVDAKQDTWLRSSDGAKAFAKLATQGADAFQAMVDAWALQEPDRLAAMISSDAVHVAMFDIDETQLAVELFYDREPPTDGEGWCNDFDVALQSGSCPSCAPWDPTARPPATVPVCPAGFWGVRKIIERTAVPTDDDGFPIVLQNRTRTEQDPIDSLDRVLIGTSDRVDKATIDGRKPTDVMLERITERISSPPSVVNDWNTWQDKIEADQPQLLVLLTHTTADALELGSDEQLERLRIKTFYVRQPFGPTPAGPVVLLLGCDTASTNSSLTSFAAKFMQRGASVVVATIGSTLGRFAAPIAGELVALIADPFGPPTVGEALREVRRATLEKGWVTGLLVNAFGAADYTFNRN